MMVASHPTGPAAPSLTDIAPAYYPEAATPILSPADRSRPEPRAYRILGGAVNEIPIQVGAPGGGRPAPAPLWTEGRGLT